MPASAATSDPLDERQLPRLEVRCPARIRIGQRQYAGFIDNLSEAGAHIVTATPIKERGPVTLQLPDFPPVKAEIRWTGSTEGGVRFYRRLETDALASWIGSRNGSVRLEAFKSGSA